MFGYHGRYLRIDLTRGTADEVPLAEDFEFTGPLWDREPAEMCQRGSDHISLSRCARRVGGRDG